MSPMRAGPFLFVILAACPTGEKLHDAVDSSSRVDDTGGASDRDGDGYDDVSAGGTDCDDDNPAVNPGAAEICGNGLDDDCTGGDLTCHDALSACALVLAGGTAGDLTGWSVAGAGDVNSDGYDDVLVGAPNVDIEEGSSAGAMYLLHGPLDADRDLSLADVERVGEGPGDNAGYDVSGAGDVNADGYDDVLVGGSVEDSSQAIAHLLFGPLSGDGNLSLADVRFTGATPCWWAGASVAGAGDLNADGFDDVLVGNCGDETGGKAAGAVFVLNGPLSGDLDLAVADVKLFGDTSNAAGMSVSGAGDVDGDGFDDVLAGAPYTPDAGAAFLEFGPLSGDRDLWLGDVVFQGEPGDDYTGNNASDAGDVNADGYDDVLVAGQGTAYLLYGPGVSEGDLSSADARFAVGTSVAGAGDVDGDGFDDVLLGDLLDDEGGRWAGGAYLFHGPVSGAFPTPEVKFVGGLDDNAGRAVSGAGDIDGDGHADLIVGAPQTTAEDAAGVAYLILQADRR